MISYSCSDKKLLLSPLGYKNRYILCNCFQEIRKLLVLRTSTFFLSFSGFNYKGLSSSVLNGLWILKCPVDIEVRTFSRSFNSSPIDWFLYDIGLRRERVKFYFDSWFYNYICDIIFFSFICNFFHWYLKILGWVEACQIKVTLPSSYYMFSLWL